MDGQSSTDGVHVCVSTPSNCIRSMANCQGSMSDSPDVFALANATASRAVIHIRQLGWGNQLSMRSSDGGSIPQDRISESPMGAVNGTPCAVKSETTGWICAAA